MADITMPQLGETVTEGTITRWFKAVGEAVAEDEVLFEVSTDKVDSEVPSPAAGVLTEIVVAEGETVEVGVVLARLDGSDTPAAPVEAAAPASPAEPAPPPAAAPPTPAEPAPPPAAAPVSSAETAVPDTSGLVLSPVVRRLISENGLDVSAIEGTGLGGRITRADVEKVAREQRQNGAPPSRAPAPVAATAASSAPAPAPAPAPLGDGEILPFNRIRQRTGEHMVMSKSTSPHVLTAIEVDYEGVELVRRAHGADFKAAEGFSLTYLPFISRALSDALEDYPRLNATVTDQGLQVHTPINLAIAVDLDFEGLLAPVVHDVASKRLRAIARDIRDRADRARSRQLGADDVVGGTFTITNAGQYGTMMQFPIINQPQVAILSTDGVRRKPVVITDEHGGESIGIHSVGVLAMAWDHRAFDGAYAAAFLNRLRTIIETNDWEAEL